MTTFYIPDTLPGLNEIIGKNRTHYHAGAKQKREAEELVMWTVAGMKPIHHRVDIHFEWVERNRRRDKDNIRAGAKFILDALVTKGVLQGDGWKHIGNLSDSYRVDKKLPGVRVTIKEAANELD